MILKLEQTSESSGGLVKRQIAGSYFLKFVSVDLGQILRISISKNFQVTLMLLFWEPHFENYWLQSNGADKDSGIKKSWVFLTDWPQEGFLVS